MDWLRQNNFLASLFTRLNSNKPLLMGISQRKCVFATLTKKCILNNMWLQLGPKQKGKGMICENE
jgi:hypothetical protein